MRGKPDCAAGPLLQERPLGAMLSERRQQEHRALGRSHKSTSQGFIPHPEARVPWGRGASAASPHPSISFLEWPPINPSLVVHGGFGEAPCLHANIAASLCR